MGSITQPDGPTGYRGVYLLTHPRSASNLFQTMLSGQNMHQGGYLIFQAFIKSFKRLRELPWTELPEDERRTITEQYQEEYAKMIEFMDEAEQKGLQCLIKEHAPLVYGPDKMAQPEKGDDPSQLDRIRLGDAPSTAYTNPSALPDTVLRSMRPVFQIRSPLLMFPSYVRAQRKAYDSTDVNIERHPVLSLRYNRALYDWYLHDAASARPVVIDADDIMKNPEAVRQLCRETGMDPDAIKYEWEARTIEEPVHKVFLSTIAASTAIVPGLDSTGLDLDVEQKKWETEFGVDAAKSLAARVRDAMSDYQYLYERRITG